MAFRVGQKVTMISKWNWPNATDGEILPEFGVIYTIREIEDDGLRFAEIVNVPQDYIEGLCEATFFAARFRPVVERKTDISIFEKMLTSKKEHARA